MTFRGEDEIMTHSPSLYLVKDKSEQKFVLTVKKPSLGLPCPLGSKLDHYKYDCSVITSSLFVVPPIHYRYTIQHFCKGKHIFAGGTSKHSCSFLQKTSMNPTQQPPPLHPTYKQIPDLLQT